MDLVEDLLAKLINRIFSDAAPSESPSASGSESDDSDFAVVKKKPVYSRNRFTDGDCLMFEELRGYHMTTVAKKLRMGMSDVIAMVKRELPMIFPAKTSYQTFINFKERK